MAWLAAGRLTVADLKAVHLLDKLINGSLTGLPTDALVAFPRVVAWRARVHDERRLRLGE
jgi:glutathione S-transferase